MKKRELAHEELDSVIRLKKLGASWLKIEHETRISRRIAKRAYEKWEHSQSSEVLREARKDVAAKAFLDHLKSLTTLAGSLVTNLSVPSSPDMMTRNAEQFFVWLWQQNVLWREPAAIYPETRERYNLSQLHVYTMGDTQSFLMGDPQFNILENQLLFKCLQDHTRGEEVRWGTLDEWRKARDTCAKVLPKLRKETSVVVNNILNQETNLLHRVKNESVQSRNVVEQMVKAVLSAIWQGIVEDKPDENLVRTRGGGQGIVKVRDETFLIFNDTGLGEKVVDKCNWAVNTLRKGEKSAMVKLLQDEVRTMEDATEKLRQVLNPVRLTPMILRTRCDLCPA